MNECIIDAKIKDVTKLNNFTDRLVFGVSISNGTVRYDDNFIRKKFTFIRVIYYNNNINELNAVKELIKYNNFIRIYGKLDSEMYVTTNGKNVYNKILIAHKIVKIKWNDESDEYIEILDSSDANTSLEDER